MFVMIDGIDGSGKSTVVSAWKQYLIDNGHKIFDLKKYFLENDHYPEVTEFADCDFIFSAEPTHTGIGKILREELSNTKNNYPPESIAEGHSLDRIILYNKVLIPALKNNQHIIQDRGLSTSLVYQPAHDSSLTLQKVAGYVGNRLAATHRPDHLVVMDITPEVACQRLDNRHEKMDNAVFEKKDFLKKVAPQFKAKELKNFFLNLGTQIHYLSGEEKIDIMKAQAIDLLKNILK